MEKVNSNLFLTSTLLIIILFLSSVLWKKRTTKRSQNAIISPKLPPGPPKLPLIGNLHQLAGSNPWRAFVDMAKIYGPIIHLRLGEISTVVVSSPRLAEEVLKTHEHAFLDRPQTFASTTMFYDKKDIAFAPYGDHWRQLRKICVMELFCNKKVSSFASMRAQAASDLVASIQSSLERPFNLTEGLFTMSNKNTCKAAFGERFEGSEELLPMLKYQIDFLGKYIFSDMFPSLRLLDVFSISKPRLRRMQQKVDSIMVNLIRERKIKMQAEEDDEPQEEKNLLDVLIRLQQNGNLESPITDTNIKAIIFELFSAGTDSSATVIEWAFSEMLRNPRIMEKAQAEVRLVAQENKTIDYIDCERMDYLKMVIKESLRLHPPGPILLPRQCREVCEIDGYTIPINTQVMVNAWAIGRDPCVWDEPESFKPERFENKHINFTGTNFELIPFGAGRRICPGISFGMAVVEIVLANLLYHFNWELPEGTEPKNLDMEEGIGIVARRKAKLYAVPYTPKPASDI